MSVILSYRKGQVLEIGARVEEASISMRWSVWRPYIVCINVGELMADQGEEVLDPWFQEVDVPRREAPELGETNSLE